MSVDVAQNMKLYITYGSPYARLARVMVIEKALEDRVEIIEAKTRTPGSPYYQINPSGRVPYLVDDNGAGMEDSQLICAYLDGLDGNPRFHKASGATDWAYLGLEFAARSMCDGITVWGREMARPENERSPTTLAHEAARTQRMADFFEDRVDDPPMQGPLVPRTRSSHHNCRESECELRVQSGTRIIALLVSYDYEVRIRGRCKVERT
jgi:glutathione S-transferase